MILRHSGNQGLQSEVRTYRRKWGVRRFSVPQIVIVTTPLTDISANQMVTMFIYQCPEATPKISGTKAMLQRLTFQASGSE